MFTEWKSIRRDSAHWPWRARPLSWPLPWNTHWALWMSWIVLAGCNSTESMSVEAGFSYHGNHILSFPQTETDRQQQRCREWERNEWLSEEHIKTESNTDGFRPPGLGLAHCWCIKKYIAPCKDRIYYQKKGQCLVYEPCWWTLCSSWQCLSTPSYIQGTYNI